MPLFDYRCLRCGAVHERLRGVSEPDPTGCPECGGPLDRLVSRPAEFRNLRPRPAGKTCCGRDERCDTPPCDSGGPCCSS